MQIGRPLACAGAPRRHNERHEGFHPMSERRLSPAWQSPVSSPQRPAVGLRSLFLSPFFPSQTAVSIRLDFSPPSQGVRKRAVRGPDYNPGEQRTSFETGRPASPFMVRAIDPWDEKTDGLQESGPRTHVLRRIGDVRARRASSSGRTAVGGQNLYLQVLRSDGNHFGSLHHLGIIALQKRKRPGCARCHQPGGRDQ